MSELTSDRRVVRDDERTGYCWQCHNLCLMNDDAQVCTDCGGRNIPARTSKTSLWTHFRRAFHDWRNDRGHW